MDGSTRFQGFQGFIELLAPGVDRSTTGRTRVKREGQEYNGVDWE